MLNGPARTFASVHPWLKVLQALLLGFVLGLAVHAGLSLMLARLGADAPQNGGGSRSGVECRKQQPSRQTAPSRSAAPASRPATTVG